MRKILSLEAETKSIKNTSGKSKSKLDAMWATKERLRTFIQNSRACVKSQVKSLEECWLKMKDLTAPLGEENTDNDLDLGSGDSIYDQTRGARRKLTDVEKSSVHLNIQDGGRNQFYINIAKEGNKKADMTNHLRSIQAEQILTFEKVHIKVFREEEMKGLNIVKRKKWSLLRNYLSRKIITWNKKRKVLKQMTR